MISCVLCLDGQLRPKNFGKILPFVEIEVGQLFYYRDNVYIRTLLGKRSEMMKPNAWNLTANRVGYFEGHEPPYYVENE